MNGQEPDATLTTPGNFITKLANAFLGVEVFSGARENHTEHLQAFLDRAECSIHMIADRLPEQFYQDPKTLAIFERVAADGIVEIFFAPSADRDSIKALTDVGVKAYMLDKRKRSHYVVVDKKHLAIQDAHDPEDKIRVWRYYNSSPAAENAYNRIQALKSRSEPVSLPMS